MMSSYSKIVSVLNLGRMGFLDAYKVQTKFARQHLDSMAGVHGSKGENVVLLVEHNPVYTIGIRSKDYSEEYEQKLKKLGAEFCRTDRGGLITYHGPGQLVAYPILNLKYFTPNMKWYICSMEKTMIGTCKYYGLNAHTTEDTGVWIGDRKIGAIGKSERSFLPSILAIYQDILSWLMLNKNKSFTFGFITIIDHYL